MQERLDHVGNVDGQELILWNLTMATLCKERKRWSFWTIVAVVQSLRHVRLCATPWTAACQASLSTSVSLSLLELMSIESVMPSNQLILCRPLLLLPSIFPSIRVFSSESALCIRWPKYWLSATASVFPMNIQDWFPLGLTGQLYLLLWARIS